MTNPIKIEEEINRNQLKENRVSNCKSWCLIEINYLRHNNDQKLYKSLASFIR